MSRKDSELIAAALRAAQANICPDHLPHVAFDIVLDSLADALATTNPRFNRARFIQAAMGNV